MVIEAAPAKINLYLHVVGRRADGFHLLDSLVVFAEIADRVEVSPAADLTLTIDGRFAESLADLPAEANIAMRAARALAGAFAVAQGAAIRLTKNLPVAAGIGGGSADAAAVLRALDRLWSLKASDRRLVDLAATLGADVPACLAGRPSFVGGIGEVVQPAPRLPSLGLVLANPGIALSTAEVFTRRRGAFSMPGRFSEPPRDVRDLAEILAARRNDLTATAARLAPAVAEIEAALASSPGCLLARMSGSGPACFGLYADEGAAGRARAWLAERAPSWWTVATAIGH
jgi:4-diphosphocytidyl-2-C-methyl-D-erythritol kinase